MLPLNHFSSGSNARVCILLTCLSHPKIRDYQQCTTIAGVEGLSFLALAVVIVQQAEVKISTNCLLFPSQG